MNGHFALRLGGETSLLAGAGGGAIFAAIVAQASGPSPYVKKHLGQPELEVIANPMPRLTAGLYCERMSLHRDAPSP